MQNSYGYVFIGNSTKPSTADFWSREPISPGMVSRPWLLAALERGYSVVLGVNRARTEELTCDLPVALYESHTYRNPFALRDNFCAIKNLCSTIRKHNIKVIHCNTPVGGYIGRLCGWLMRVPIVIYTAHGFHFYSGAPGLAPRLYRLAELVMARKTDVIITMNKEDYEAAKSFSLRKGGKVYCIPGVGVDTKAFSPEPSLRKKVRTKLGSGEEDVLLLSVGDLIRRKNHEVCIRGLAGMELGEKVRLYLCGDGPERERLESLANSLGLRNHVVFLGRRDDVADLLRAADVFVHSSFQEGLPRVVMEAMATGLPCLVSRVRGNTDLVTEGVGGYLFNPYSASEFRAALSKMLAYPEETAIMGRRNLERVSTFDAASIEQLARDIYHDVLGPIRAL